MRRLSVILYGLIAAFALSSSPTLAATQSSSSAVSQFNRLTNQFVQNHLALLSELEKQDSPSSYPVKKYTGRQSQISAKIYKIHVPLPYSRHKVEAYWAICTTVWAYLDYLNNDNWDEFLNTNSRVTLSFIYLRYSAHTAPKHLPATPLSAICRRSITTGEIVDPSGFDTLNDLWRFYKVVHQHPTLPEVQLFREALRRFPLLTNTCMGYPMAIDDVVESDYTRLLHKPYYGSGQFVAQRVTLLNTYLPRRTPAR